MSAPKILHVLPHLGGGVGKAHAALCAAIGGRAQQTFVLLEKPLEERYIASIRASGATVIVQPSLFQIVSLSEDADIIQIDWWQRENPMMIGLREDTPLVVWCHQRAPTIPENLASIASCLIGTAPVCNLPFTINSGFGFERVRPKTGYGTRVGYLGTLDYRKLSPVLFDVADLLAECPTVWGEWKLPFLPHSSQVHFCGRTDHPAEALRDIDIFFYPLQPDHYGTGENALVEAMSVGCCPVVLNNPCEAAIVEDGVTGFVCNDAYECYEAIKYLQAYPNEIRRMGQAAARYVAEHKTAAQSAQQFLDLWTDLISQPHEPHGAVAPLPVLGAD